MEDQQDPSIKRFSQPVNKAQQDNLNQGKEDDSLSEKGELLTSGNYTPEIATNDGSIIETLDTVFHGAPGWSEGENISGSNRADYYEARSNGKSDSEEEVDDLRERNAETSEKDGNS